MTKVPTELDFWVSLCADVNTAQGLQVCDPPATSAEIVGDNFVIRAEVPGFDATELTVSWDDMSVRIVGEATLPEGQYSGYGAPCDFVLRRYVPTGFDTSRLEAELPRGLLILTIAPCTTSAPVHPVDANPCAEAVTVQRQDS